jgi:hypothetical protein
MMSGRGVLRTLEGGKVAFWCPGCKALHAIGVTTGTYDWHFNNNYDAPTFEPSILVTGRDFTDAGWAAYRAWCDGGYQGEPPRFEARDTRCHSFVRNGAIQFLPDCTHALAGKTVRLEEC